MTEQYSERGHWTYKGSEIKPVPEKIIVQNEAIHPEANEDLLLLDDTPNVLTRMDAYKHLGQCKRECKCKTCAEQFSKLQWKLWDDIKCDYSKTEHPWSEFEIPKPQFFIY